MPHPRTLLAAAAATLALTATAQADPKPDTASILTIQGENSSISAAKQTDRFYTNGLRLEWTSPTGQVPGFLASLGNSLWGNGQQRFGVGLSQQMYTPYNTAVSPADPHDRPYAGILTANFSLLSDTDDSRSVLMLSLGVVGPASGARWVQDTFHDVIGQGKDHGWGSQIPNAPAVEILHERTWRLPIAQFGGLETDALPAITVGLGTVRDYVQVGGTVRIGQGLDSDFGVPRIRPGLSGGDAYTPTRPFAWYLFAGANGQAVAYDILLQSSPFRGGPHVSPVWDVAELQAGAAIMAYGVRLTFAYVAQTQEFKGQQGGLVQFGSASLGVRF
jgi:hypothetical protein